MGESEIESRRRIKSEIADHLIDELVGIVDRKNFPESVLRGVSPVAQVSNWLDTANKVDQAGRRSFLGAVGGLALAAFTPFGGSKVASAATVVEPVCESALVIVRFSSPIFVTKELMDDCVIDIERLVVEEVKREIRLGE